MRQPIILWQNERTLSTDDAGVTILSSVSPPRTYFQPGPYYDEDVDVAGPARCPKPLSHVPSLSYFCIKHLVKIPEMLYNYGPARPYRSPEYPGDSDILRTLPRTPQCNVDLSKVDPRLWAVIVQVYSDLPSGLHIYRTALADKYLPSLQRIPTTEHFSLLTVLEIPGCSHLTDDTIVRLAVIHTLCVLDASNTPLTAQGIRRLSGTLRWGDDGVDIANQRRGPWQLRILSLRNCKQVTDNIYQCLESFMLLAVVDLRGTRCTWDREKVPSSFFPANEKQLYHPTTPLEALSLLTSSPSLLPSRNTALLHIDHLTHSTPEHHRDRGKFLVHRDSMARDDVGFQYDFNAFWPSNTGRLKTQSHRQKPQWGQELLMLYREPPPWSKVQDPPIVKGPPKTRSSNELAAVRRTDEQAMKGLQKLQDMLSERRRIAGAEADSSCDGLKVSAKYSAPRNPFATSHSGGSSENVSGRADEKSRAFSPHTHKSIMEAPPKSLRSLKPITTLPVPRPPNSVKQASANKGRDVRRVLPRPQLSHESSQKRVSVSLHIDDSEGQKAEMMVASTGTRCASGRADPAVGRKRHRIATPATGTKK
ncbi:hypothetical protein EDB84DRAFT_1411074 [Lactarius hengduanensis]|nr:hypothetical protein EDB84DRAFT_1411074 [Lactarius hengduanensis]